MISDQDVVIRVEGLGKKYTIQHERPDRYKTLRDSLTNRTAALARWANPFTLSGQIQRAQRHAQHEQRSGQEDFWALKDVSFEIRRGERVGIIGRNGAGKSTLLKILSRITEPTTGRVAICGRVASLLEVGTGFHPELTGRENIYLNGAILGMTRREIKTKFEEIVDFAEVEKFLDTPVKRYSSGMYVRLAFAVAAHLEPQILVVDEVLAVGDASFQKKCLGKMEEVADNEGRTILFVSHNLEAVRMLCERGLYLVNGKIQLDGITSACSDLYLASSPRKSASANPVRVVQPTYDSEGTQDTFVEVRISSIDNIPKNSFSTLEPIIISTTWSRTAYPSTAKPNIHVKNGYDSTVFCSISDLDLNHRNKCDTVQVHLEIPPLLLNSGEYFISLYFTSFAPVVVHGSWQDIISFVVEEDVPYRFHQGYCSRLPGDILLSSAKWSIND